MTAWTREERTGWPSFPRRLVDEQVGFALMVWAGFAAVVLVFILGAHAWGDVTVSGWDQAADVVRWYAFFIGIYVGWDVLPLHISHGQTRRDFARQAVIFVVVFGAAIAAMVTITYVAEAGLYRAAGWPQEIRTGQFFDSGIEAPSIFLQHTLVTAVWAAGGVFVAAAWYRRSELGLLAMVPAVLVATISGHAMHSRWGPFVEANEYVFGGAPLNTAGASLVHIGLLAALFWMTWMVVRDIPIRNTSGDA